MDENLKHRIIGAIVIISCAVIFIPMIFDPENAEEFVLKSEIPAAPPKPNVTIPDPIRPDATQSLQVDPRNAYSLLEEPNSAEVPPTDQSAIDDSALNATQEPTDSASTDAAPEEIQAEVQDLPSSSETAKPKESMLNKEGLPKAWVVQVGSFKEKARALELEELLIKKGYRAFTRTTVSKTPRSGETAQSTRVYVGPKLEKSTALALKKTLDEDLKVSSLVIPFTADG